MKTLTDKQAEAILAFCDSFDLVTAGAWAGIEEHMREEFGMDDPEAALTDALDALRS